MPNDDRGNTVAKPATIAVRARMTLTVPALVLLFSCAERQNMVNERLT
jgi:hypothetical protein